MKLAGEVRVGHFTYHDKTVYGEVGGQWIPIPRNSVHDVIFKMGPGHVIVHDAVGQYSFSVMAIDTPAGTAPTRTTFDFKETDTCRHPFDYTSISSAPLDNVVCARIFENDEEECMGIILEYENGGMRSLGQCRLGVDFERRYYKPRYMCIHQYHVHKHRNARRLNLVRVAFTSSNASVDHAHSHPLPNYTTYRRDEQNRGPCFCGKQNATVDYIQSCRHASPEEQAAMDEQLNQYSAEEEVVPTWECMPMTGWVDFLFSHNEMTILRDPRR